MASAVNSRAGKPPVIVKPASLAQHIVMVLAWFGLAIMAGTMDFPTPEECIGNWNSTLQWMGDHVKNERVNTN